MIKNFEMGRLSWIIQVGRKCNHKCPCKRDAEGDLTMKGQRQYDKEVGDEKVMCARKGSDPNNVGNFQKLEKARKQLLS